MTRASGTGTWPAGWAVAAFHVRVGASLAVRAAAPLVAALVAGLGLQYDPSGALVHFASAVVGTGADPAVGVLLAVVGAALAGWAAPRITAGSHGWICHLPVSGLTRRRAATAGIAVGASPIGAAVVVFSVVVVVAGGTPMWPTVVGIPVLLWTVALAHSGARRFVVAPVALVAAALAVSGSWARLAAALLLAVAAEALAGTAVARHRRVRRSTAATTGLPTRIALRAAAGRLVGAAACSLLPLGAAALFRANNALDGPVACGAARLGGGLALTLVAAALAETLAVRRPAWPWSRSLPWSAAARVGADAALLSTAALPALIVLAWIEPWALLPVVAIVPWVTVRAAGAMRRAPERPTGAAGEVLAEAGLLAAWVALLPWLAVGALLATPVAMRLAVRREHAQKVSRWLAIHHLAVGDPLAWSSE